MTATNNTTGHGGRPLCGGKKHQGEGTCTQAAGWGTSHPGVGRCKLHGGATQSHESAARKVQAEQVLRRVWNPDASPVTDSVAALQRLAGRLEQAVDVIGAQLTVGEPCEACGRGDVDLGPVNVAAWTRTVRELRTALVEMERLGIASRQVELARGQAELVMAGLLAVFELLRPSPGDRERAVQVFLGALGRGELVAGELEGATT